MFFCIGTFGITAIADALTGDGDAAFYVVLAFIVLVVFFVFWGYFVLFETVWNGQTPGKRWTGLRVIQEGGYPIGFSHAAIRNIVRLVDFLPVYYVVGATVMLIDKRSRRLGDLLAGTIVVRERRDVTLESLGTGGTWLPTVTYHQPPSVPGAVAPAVATTGSLPNLHRLTPADQSLLLDYFNRRPTLTTEAATQLSMRLATVYAKKLEYVPAGDVPEQFLARLARELRARQMQPPSRAF
jgi:uncharacterized RDD family membrane protein YckC